MKETKLGVIESRFADLIWANAPIPSGELAKIAEKELNWKRTTTYTVLKRLCDRGIFRNDSGTVHIMIAREDFYAMQSEKFVNETFDGSLPAFLAAFGKRKKLNDREIDELQKIIDSMRR